MPIAGAFLALGSGGLIGLVLGLIGGGGSIELKRTELRRVKPYGDRFEVKIGTLKAIDF